MTHERCFMRGCDEAVIAGDACAVHASYEQLRAALAPAVTEVERLRADLDCYRVDADQWEIEARRLRGILGQIEKQAGAVCPEYEVCTHPACQASYAAWALARGAFDEEPHDA